MGASEKGVYLISPPNGNLITEHHENHRSRIFGVYYFQTKPNGQCWPKMEHEWTHRSGYSAGLVYLKMILFHFDKCICIVVSLISICLALCLSHTNIDGCNRFHPGLTLWITNQQYWSILGTVPACSSSTGGIAEIIVGVGMRWYEYLDDLLSQSKQTRILIGCQ